MTERPPVQPAPNATIQLIHTGNGAPTTLTRRLCACRNDLGQFPTAADFKRALLNEQEPNCSVGSLTSPIACAAMASKGRAFARLVGLPSPTEVGIILNGRVRRSQSRLPRLALC